CILIDCLEFDPARFRPSAGSKQIFQRIVSGRLSYRLNCCMGQLDEEQNWIRQSRNGDQEAFAALVTRYQRMVHSLTFRMTGSLADGEDLAQETFIQAFRRIASFRGEAKFSSWLYRIAVNTCLNWKKSQTRRA